MRCEACGALNPPNARWCNQCLERFDAPVTGATVTPLRPPHSPETETPAEEPFAPVSAPPTPTPTEPVDLYADLPTAADAAPRPPVPSLQAAVGTKKGPFTVTDGGVVWTCSSCGETNPLDVEICTTCGMALRHTLAPDEDTGVQRDPRLTTLVALSFPGAGHAYLQQWGQAVARGAIALWALVAVVAGLSLDARGGRPMAAVIFIGLAGFWAVSVHDAQREAERRPRETILKGRMFLWVVLGLLGLQLAQLLLGATSSL